MDDEVIVVSEGPEPIVVVLAQPAPVVVQDEQPEPVVLVGGTYPVRGDPGLSAYQQALADGFAGTEQQWLASLKADATELVQEHVVAPLPHPVYDDMVDLTLLFQNGLV